MKYAVVPQTAGVESVVAALGDLVKSSLLQDGNAALGGVTEKKLQEAVPAPAVMMPVKDGTSEFATWLENDADKAFFRHGYSTTGFGGVNALLEKLFKQLDNNVEWPAFASECCEPLTWCDVAALLLYTSEDPYLFKVLNAAMCSPNFVDQEPFGPWVLQLCSAFDKLPGFSGVVFCLLEESIVNATECNVGTPINFPSFSPCSTVLSLGKKTRESGGWHRLVLHVKRAARLGPLSSAAGAEVVVDSGWHGKVINKIDHAMLMKMIPGVNFEFSSLLELREIDMENPDAAADEEYAATPEQLLANATTCANYATLMADHHKEYRKAAQLYQRSLGLEPGNSMICKNFATLTADNSLPTAPVVEAYERALQRCTVNANLAADFANFLVDHTDEYTKAAAHFERALELDPQSAAIYTGYAGLLRKHLKNPEKAGEMYHSALRADQKSLIASYHYATLLADDLGDYRKAAGMFEWALRVDPGHAHVRCDYGNLLLYKLDDAQKAAAMFDKSLESNPDSVSALCGRGLIALNDRDFDLAKELFQHALKIDPNDTKAQQAMELLKSEVPTTRRGKGKRK